ncbi:MAG: pyuvate ferredoxin oxidoreductase subunit delta [Alphaproteobacteria bacterium ADurb.Bin438]|nr:MAG: pyuvate ferredoxin oxidoreductase subunit delta [Alphaproteobacteria bacterium ADurb.Bin438]
MTIFYFSGTGNSVDIADKIGDKNVYSIPCLINEKKEIKISDDCVGIIFPVYSFAPPKMVLEFCSLIKDKIKDKYVYTIAHGGGLCGSPGIFIYKALQKLDAYFDLIMPSNDVFLTRVSTEEEAKEVLENAYIEIEKIKEKINNKEKSDYKKNIFSDLLSYIGKFIFDKLAKPDISKKFYVVKERCVKCGICKKNCPNLNIDYDKEGYPIFKNNCSYCSACINLCPFKAINYKKKTEHKPRYKNPILKI